MADATVQLLSSDKPASGRALEVSADGLLLQLVVPPGRKLERITLALRADSGATKAATGVTVSGDVADLPNNAARWVRAEWAEERALAGLAFAANTANAAGRIRILSDGIWLPLMPLDTLPITTANQGFAPLAASAVSVEVLAQNDQKVLVPGAAKVGGLSFTVSDQPCHVALAVGDDPPFFRQAGVLPLVPVEVGGLARLVNRYLLDHPGSRVVPLRLTAAATRKLRIERFDAILQAEAVDPRPDGGGPAPENPHRPRPGEVASLPPVAVPAAIEARRLSDAYRVAQRFRWDETSQVVSAVALFARRAEAEPQLALALYADDGGQPGGPPLGGMLQVAAEKTTPDWIRARWPETLALTKGDYWLVASAQHGDALWYTGTERPTVAGDTLFSVDAGPWLPIGDAARWAQLAVYTVPADAS
ncbi:hypothetical protein [Chitinolyticbacter meiyuanensis]|uniref:hypothetical protein n=1 Tax=Chitinolyticbacter meiyuanensis TaxID=682798 RepID=UPI0011E5FE4F|nr:hypothetical protein [Chitinolyticbacter meiyuanensis]